MKISDIGESEWVAIIQRYVTPPEELSLDDDAVDFRLDQRYTVINVDTWVESTDRPLTMDLVSCGYKAVSNAVSDVIAKGAVPRHILASINLPGFTEVTDAEMIVQGMSEACLDMGLTYRGGDVNQQSADVSITITCIGEMDVRPIPRHGELQEGDEVWWLGAPLGSTGAILHLLLENLDYSKYEIKAMRYFLRPALSYDFVGVAGEHREQIISSMDCSDGLAKSLHSLVKDSPLGIKLDPAILDVEPWIAEIAMDNVAVSDFVLFGGEELSVIIITRGLDLLDRGFVRLGGVVKSHIPVTLNGLEVPNRGWQHFS